ncbi:MAG TPA: transposase [Pirellulaceae bacterium]|nr:transposase [Pirellulaceae bacterium]
MATSRLVPYQKRARRRGATVVFLDETGFMLRPLTRRTWATKDETPILRASAKHDRLSAIGAVTLSPKTKRIGLRWQFYDGNVRTPEFLAFLRSLRRWLRTPLIVVMDRLNVHRSAARQLRESGARWFEAEFLPDYAPDLNSVEAVWSCVKHVDLANYAPDDLFELGDAAGESFVRQLRDRRVRESYFQTAKLSLR